MKPLSIHVLMISKALINGAYHKKLEEIARLGITLDVVIPEKWGDQKAEQIQGNGYTIHVLPVVFSGKNHFHYYPSLSTLIKKTKPDIIHVDEESYSFITYSVIRQARNLKIPTLFFNWQNILKNFQWPFSAMERYSMKYAAAGIAGNREAKDVLLKKGCSIPIHVIPQFGVDCTLFSRQDQSELRKTIIGNIDAFVVGFSGRFVEEKGIRDLISACSRLSSQVHLVLIGGGPLRNDFVQQASSLGMGIRFHIIDSVVSTEMPKYLNILDCLVLASLTRINWKEQFGRVLIEAMACEVPVIGSSSGEIPNVIGQAGRIFPEGDIYALQKTLQELVLNRTLCLEMGKEGRRRVLENYTQKKIAEDTAYVYSEIVNKYANRNQRANIN
jgi:glycosyltransferase involved in cell wall biosynthesis